MRRIAVVIAFLVASSLMSFARTEETLEQLKSRAKAANSADQPKLFLDIASRQLREADAAFTAGDAEKGHAAVQEVVTYSERAGEAARTSGKSLKQTEIGVRRIARRLD